MFTLYKEAFYFLSNVASKARELVYHRLDLLPTDNTCMHLKQLSTMEQSALFLAANSFKKPFEHLSQDETKKMVQVYLTYLSDHTELIANPGIRVRINTILALPVNFKQQRLNGSDNN